jgi:hypothetical protein
MKDKVIVSMASLGRENYNEAMLNMIKSCTNNWWHLYGDFMLRSQDGYCDEYMGVKIKLGSWPVTKLKGVSWQHKEMPYQFKPFAIQEAREAGYKKILWMDSTCRMIKLPEPMWDIVGERGILAWDNLGHPVLPYTSDTAMKNFRHTTESLQGVKQIMACCMMFDFNVPITTTIFERWLESSLDNSFYPDETNRPGFISPRHDQAAMSIILDMFKIPLQDYGDGFAYHPHEITKEYGKEIYLINKGVKD